jgi:hypothetical protein
MRIAGGEKRLVFPMWPYWPIWPSLKAVAWLVGQIGAARKLDVGFLAFPLSELVSRGRKATWKATAKLAWSWRVFAELFGNVIVNYYIIY